ncbi:MAG: GldG family protein [Acidobacteria bacterium]|nr:GldG family protein [Acidobacteriota bacterium]
MKKPSFSWLKTRQTKYGLYLAAYIVVVLALLAVVNWAVNRHSKSWDLTANKQYSLSDQTKKIVRGLNRNVKIYCFDRERQFGRAKDLLDMYDRLSPKISVEYIDPDRKPAIARDLQVKSYGSIILVSGDRRQEVSVLDEESVTTALIRLVKSGEKNVCFVEGHGEASIEDSDRRGLSRAKKALEDSTYKTKTVSLLRDPKVPADCTVTVIDGPKNEYVQTEVDALRKYVEGGGRALFLLDPGAGEKLGELLASWSVELKQDLVIDLNPVNQLFGADVTMPIITEYKSHTITREMARVATIMPFARSVAAGKDSKAGITVETLFETSAESWATKFTPEMKQVALERSS